MRTLKMTLTKEEIPYTALSLWYDTHLCGEYQIQTVAIPSGDYLCYELNLARVGDGLYMYHQSYSLESVKLAGMLLWSGVNPCS